MFPGTGPGHWWGDTIRVVKYFVLDGPQGQPMVEPPHLRQSQSHLIQQTGNHLSDCGPNEPGVGVEVLRLAVSHDHAHEYNVAMHFKRRRNVKAGDFRGVASWRRLLSLLTARWDDEVNEQEGQEGEGRHADHQRDGDETAARHKGRYPHPYDGPPEALVTEPLINLWLLNLLNMVA